MEMQVCSLAARRWLQLVHSDQQCDSWLVDVALWTVRVCAWQATDMSPVVVGDN